LEKEKTATTEIGKLVNQQREQIDSLTANLAEEKRAELALREQLDHTKVIVSGSRRYCFRVFRLDNQVQIGAVVMAAVCVSG